jgi:hypothetical protein
LDLHYVVDDATVDPAENAGERSMAADAPH